MSRLCMFLLSGLLLFTAPLFAADPPAEEYHSLLNGRDLEGWHAQKPIDPRAFRALDADQQIQLKEEAASGLARHWRVEAGVLQGTGSPFALTSDRLFGDIEMQVEFAVDAAATAVLYLRQTPALRIGPGSKRGDAPELPLVGQQLPAAQWHQLKVIQVGEQTEVFLNDRCVLSQFRQDNAWDAATPLADQGAVQWRVDGGALSLKAIRVRGIAADEANEWLGRDDSHFERLFNGLDFSGWTGPTENYDVQEGAIVCRPGKGGTVYTQGEYADFVVRLEFQLPPGGNNGLAIRYPGEGDTAYMGMCELQVLDNSAVKYATQLDPRQYHGSAYGMVAAHRGYLRPVGQWNFQEVRVQGSTIQVELNGTRILDADLEKVTEYMGNRPHPGKSRTKGHFGLAGHSDPVRFRNLRIRSL